MRRPPYVKQTLITSSDSTIHPIFHPVSIFSRSPLLETDYNLHRSNSTYFFDLNISRTALVTSLLFAGFRTCNAALEAERHRGANNVILGSVHTSYHREIKPYERYEVGRGVLGWDQKWLVILSAFLRPRQGKREEVVLASALSKYVVKKARFTVPPVRVWRVQVGLRGWIWLGHRRRRQSRRSRKNLKSY